MSQLNRTSWEALYGTSGTEFPDNTTGLISELIMRTFGKNASDSLFFKSDDSYTAPFPQVTATGTNTYAATLSPAITAYATGQKFQIKFTNASSGVSTLNLNAVGAKKIFINPTTQATTGHIVAGQISILVYDSALDSAVGGFLMLGSGFATLQQLDDLAAYIDGPILEGVTAEIAAALAGLKWKEPVRVATTVTGTLATDYENGDTIDGVVLATGNRILLKDQSTQSENGIYTVNASGAPTRATDANSAAELEGAVVTVQEGTSNENTTWNQTTDGITLGSSNIVWSQFGSSVPDATDTTKGKVELATPAEVITGTSTTLAVTPEGVHGKVVGVQDLYYPAKGGSPRITGGCSIPTPIEFTTSLVNIPVLAFDQTTQEFAQFEVVPPRKWNNGTITVVPYWTAQAGTGTVRWAINGGVYRNDDALTVALGTAQNSDDTLIATDDLHIGPATSAITLAGTGADGNLVVIQVARDPANDTLNADALLIGISIRFTTDSAIDA